MGKSKPQKKHMKDITLGNAKLQFKDIDDLHKKIERVKSNPSARMLFDGLSKSEPLRNIMLSRRIINEIEIMENVPIQIPFVYHESPPPKELIQDSTLEVESERSDANSAIMMEKVMEIIKPELESFAKHIESMNIDEEYFSQFSGVFDKDSIQIGMIFSAVFNKKRLQNAFDIFKNQLLDEVPPLILNIASLSKIAFASYGYELNKNILTESSVSYKEYDQTITKLSKTYKVINPFISIAYCNDHPEDPFSFYIFGHQLLPSMKCCKCNAELSIGTFYYFEPEVSRLIRNKDGFILPLIAWYAEKANVDWVSQVYIKKDKESLEHDFIFLNEDNTYGVIETKMFERDTPNRTVASNIRNGLKQLEKRVYQMKKNDLEVTKAIFASNYVPNKNDRKEILEIANKGLKKDLKISPQIVWGNEIHKLFTDE